MGISFGRGRKLKVDMYHTFKVVAILVASVKGEVVRKGKVK